jgi:excisionase family DNA binding protein
MPPIESNFVVINFKNKNMKQEFLSFKEAVAYLGISSSTLYKLTSTKQIKFYKPKGKIFFKKEDLTIYITQSEVSVSQFNIIADADGK